MTDEKICPFMSKPGTQMHTIGLVDSVYCQKDRCMAWGKMHVIDYDNPDPDSPCIIIEGCRLIP